MISKKEMRSLVRQRKKEYTQEQLILKSRPIMDGILNHPVVKAAHTIMMYASLPDEVYTIDILDELLDQGKRVLLPEVISDTDMRLRVYAGPATLREGSFHILEPTGEICSENEPIDVAIVPGMGFDSEGHRLGRGKGYYDRFLSHVSTYKIGVCFDFQLMEQIPCEEYDVVMDEVVCDS